MPNERDQLAAYLRRELVGPVGGPDEKVSDPPHRRYIMGTLFPRNAATDEVVEIEGEDEPTGVSPDDTTDDPVRLANEWMPSSMGVSFYFVGNPALECDVWGAWYKVEGAWRNRRWLRVPIADDAKPERRTIVKGADGRTPPTAVLDGKAKLQFRWRPLGKGYLVTVSLINDQVQKQPEKVDPEMCLFQVGLRCRPVGSQVLEYPSLDVLSGDPESHQLRLLHRHSRTFAVGHGCAALWPIGKGPAVDHVECGFMPEFEVPPVVAALKSSSPILDIAALADPDADDALLIRGLDSFVEEYEKWIKKLPSDNSDIPTNLDKAKRDLLTQLHTVAKGMRRGIQLLKQREPMRAFRLANRAMLMQMRHSKSDIAGTRRKRGEGATAPVDYLALSGYNWYPFQLAFILLVLPSVTTEDDEDRDIVDLLWFPTGGGKTEAYLAVAAYVIFLRRILHKDRGAGTAVITRYTLRLLTSQQFQRASALICACELIRRDHVVEMGAAPISIGLWVGEGLTPNRFAGAVEAYNRIREQDEPKNAFQLEQCPWCGTGIVPRRISQDSNDYGIDAQNASFRLFCPSDDCSFHERLPVSVVDDDIYANPPTVVIGTVDKFARLTFEEHGAALFGRGVNLPPGLIIQDELHLLSGPLGTTVGLYETAIEALIHFHGSPPKVIASTATIRRAGDQVEGLFGRRVRLFPPPGLDAANSYFSRIDDASPGRRFVGILSASHTMSTAIVHLAAALLQAPVELRWAANHLDDYWTLVVYHNSLRELGRTVTLARDDIPARMRVLAVDQHNMRPLGDDTVVELTSNVEGAMLPAILARLQSRFDEGDPVSLLATTNMLSVGVDVQRLSLMLMNSQPKSTSEYIQATSRVGRGGVPGLVVTLYSCTKPRDRSHYEAFIPYHSALYRQVEPTSVTPFSLPSRNRALHAVLVTIVRHGAGLSTNADASQFDPDSPEVKRAIEVILRRAELVDRSELKPTADHLNRLCAEWIEMADKARGEGKTLYYRASGRAVFSLLKDFGAVGQGWETLSSMRSVDFEVPINVMGEK